MKYLRLDEMSPRDTFYKDRENLTCRLFSLSETSWASYKRGNIFDARLVGERLPRLFSEHNKWTELSPAVLTYVGNLDAYHNRLPIGSHFLVSKGEYAEQKEHGGVFQAFNLHEKDVIRGHSWAVGYWLAYADFDFKEEPSPTTAFVLPTPHGNATVIAGEEIKDWLYKKCGVANNKATQKVLAEFENEMKEIECKLQQK